MSSKPLLSVCMITYNQEAFIEEAIEGVLMQETDFSIELVIGEDCSTDRTRSICEAYQLKHPDIVRILPTEDNLGMMPNFVRTLTNCRGDYIALCEGDDYWVDPLKLQKQTDFLTKNPKYSGVSSCTRIFRQSTKTFEEKPNCLSDSEQDIFPSDFLDSAYVYTATITFRNGLVEYQVLSDYSWGDRFLHLLLADKGPLKFFPEVGSIYRIHSAGAMHTIIPSSVGKFLDDYITFLTHYNLVTEKNYEAAINKKISYLKIQKNISTYARPFHKKAIDIVKYLARRETKLSFEEMKNIGRLAYPRTVRKLRAGK